MAPESSPKPSQLGGTVVPKQFDVNSLPILTDRDVRDKGCFKVANFFSDLKRTPHDDKEGRRASHAILLHLAEAYTFYFRSFIRESQRTGISRKEYRNRNPVLLPGGEERYLKAAAFQWRLKEFLKEMGADHERRVRLPDGVIPILRLGNDQLVNPGPKFEMNSGQALMVLAAINDFPGYGYVRIHDLLKDRMADADFIYKNMWDCPTVRQVRTLLTQVPVTLRMALAKGNKALFDSFGTTRARHYGDLNHVWAGDAFFLKDFRFLDEDGKLHIPAVTYILECSVRCLVSHDVHLEPPNSLRGLKVIRQGILPKAENEEYIHLVHGKPDSFLSDNSSPFGTNQVKTSLKRLDIEPLRIKPRRPAQNARAERFGGTLKPYLKRYVRKALIKAFPEYDYAAKKRPLSWTQLDHFKRVVAMAIFQYHHRFHRGLQCTPAEALGKALEKHPFKEMDPEMVIRSTSASGKAEVGKEGILLDGKFFDSDELKDFRGRNVSYIFDPFGTKPELKVYQGAEMICVASLVGPGIETELRESLKGSPKDLSFAMSSLATKILETHRRTRKPGRISSEEVYKIQGQHPELVLPLFLPALPQLYERLELVNTAWRPKTLVDTVALRKMETMVTKLAGENALAAFEARHGNAKTFLSQLMVARKDTSGLERRALRIEIKDAMETKALVRALLAAAGHPKTPPDITAAFTMLKTMLAEQNVGLLIVDNADELSPESLRILGELTQPESSAVITPLPGPQMEFPLVEKPAAPPPALHLGILLTGVGFSPAQVGELREFNWHGCHPLPHLAIEEMAALLQSYDPRFGTLVEAARVANSPELDFLKVYYGLTEGAFRRFENILTRLVPLLGHDASPSLDELRDVLDRYAADNYRGSPQATDKPVVVVLP
jgi:transposase InsO family protein